MNLFNKKNIIINVFPYKNNFIIKYYSKLKNKDYTKIIYIPHGITSINGFILNKKKYSNDIIYYCGDKLYSNIIKKNNMLYKNIHGLPQLDLLLKYKNIIINNKKNIYIENKIPINKKLILIIFHRNKKFPFNTNKFIDLLCEFIETNKLNYHILLKFKGSLSIKLENYNKITIIKDKFIYNYYACDINIITHWSSCYIESLLINPYTILYNNIDNIDNNLMIAKSYEELFNFIINKFNINNDYLLNINKYINYQLGYNLELVSDKIINEIINNNKNKISNNNNIMDVSEYWKNKKISNNKTINSPNSYADVDENRGENIINSFKNINLSKNSTILEMGCNVGRNLNYLYKNGYKNLTGVEICP